MEIKQYILLVKKWFWLLIVGSVLGAVIGFGVARVTKPVYQTQTKVLVTSNRQQDPAVTLSYLSDQQLLDTYVELLQTQPLLDSVSKEVGFTVSADQISVVQVRQTQIIQITVEDQNPQHAAQIANSIINVLVQQNENLQAGRFTSTENSLDLQITQLEDQITQLRTQFDQISQQDVQQQLAQVEKQIKTTGDEISALQKDISSLSLSNTVASNIELNTKQARFQQLLPVLTSYEQIRSNLQLFGNTGNNSRQDFRTAQLQATLNLYQQLYLNLLNNKESLQLMRLQYTPNIAQIETAIVPDSPIRPSSARYTLLGILIGLLLAAATAAAIEFLNDTVNSPKDVLNVLGLNTLASIPDFSTKNLKDEIYIFENPKSLVTDAFRLLRTGILYGNTGKAPKTLLVVSPGIDEGKTSVALNLAASFSLLGRRVTVVDANIRSPRLHVTLGVENNKGLSDVLSNQAELSDSTRLLGGQKNISALTGGSISENPTELLESDKLTDLLTQLAHKTDLVILDGPPVFFADALAFASRVDGILLVLRPGRTKIETARAALDYLHRSGGNIIGVVLSRVPRNWEKYHEGFYFSPEKLATAKD